MNIDDIIEEVSSIFGGLNVGIRIQIRPSCSIYDRVWNYRSKSRTLEEQLRFVKQTKHRKDGERMDQETEGPKIVNVKGDYQNRR